MLSICFYLLFIALLVFWMESSLSFGTNSLKIKRPPADLLEDWLKGFHFGNRSNLSRSASLPKYKFYTEVVEVLLNLARRMGGNYQDSLLFLRKGLQSDRQFEKKLKELILGCWLQMGLMMVLTWGFILSALSMVEIEVKVLHLLFILFWQSLGMALLPLLLRYYRVKFFGDIGKLWKMLYILNSLAKVPLSRTEVLTAAGVADLKHITQKSLQHLVDKLKDICQRALQLGGSYEEDVEALMNELSFQEKWHFELFEKRLMVIKLGLLSIFFLPSYLAFIFLLLGELLSSM